jgi:hypothetical protein
VEDGQLTVWYTLRNKTAKAQYVARSIIEFEYWVTPTQVVRSNPVMYPADNKPLGGLEVTEVAAGGFMQLKTTFPGTGYSGRLTVTDGGVAKYL